MDPVNLELSVPPQVISPLALDSDVVGANAMPRMLEAMTPCETRFPLTVGTVDTPETVSSVKSRGPIPTIPSTPEKPDEVDATPIDCLVITRPVPSVTVSVYSLPENDPDP